MRDYRQGNNGYRKATVIEVTSSRLEQKKEILSWYEKVKADKHKWQVSRSGRWPEGITVIFSGNLGIDQVEENTTMDNFACQLS